MAAGIELGIDGLEDVTIIGRGGFSTVYSARDPEFDRRVAVKVLHNLDEAGLRRFDRERRIMGQLSDHANVLTPYRSDYTTDGNPYLVMELVEGGSLADYLVEKGPMPHRDAIEHVIAIARALEYAHERGVLHRDLKPANILVSNDGVAHLTDFGISAVQGATATQTAFTLAHSPPETFATGHDSRDERSDLYSLASTLYNLVTGAPPFASDSEEDSQTAMMRRIETMSPPPLPDGVGPPALSRFLADAMAKSPSQRPQSARDFREDLEQILADGTYVERVADDQPTRLVPPPAGGPATVGAQSLIDASPLTPPAAAVGLPWWRQGRMLASVAALSVVIAVGFVGASILLPSGNGDFDAAVPPRRRFGRLRRVRGRGGRWSGRRKRCRNQRRDGARYHRHHGPRRGHR